MDSSTHTPYRHIAKAYDTILSITGFKRGVERFLDRLTFDLPQQAKVLDAGSGTGLIARYLSQRFSQAEIYAFDIDRQMLAAMTREIEHDGIGKQNIFIAEGDLNTPHQLRAFSTGEPVIVPPNYFDAIFVSGALEHVPLAETVAKLTKLLKPGGIFFNLGVRKSATGRVLRMMYRFRPYTIHEMHRAFETAGLAEIRTLRLGMEDFPANLSRIAILAKKRT